MTGKSGPTPKQAKFLLLLDCLEALFGGAAGGGKSDALLMAAAMFLDVPGYAAIIFRRSFTDLNKPGALISRSFEWWGKTAARWDGINHTWHFPSGASLTFGFLENDRDVFHHQSAEYQFEGWDEITQFTEYSYRYMISRMRRLKLFEWLPLRVRSASNPPHKIGGVVQGYWVKSYFLPWFVCHHCGFKMQTEDLDLAICPECNSSESHVEFNCDEESGEPRVFIPSTLDDNIFLDKTSYIKSLNRLDPITREQLRRGSWKVSSSGMLKREWFVNGKERLLIDACAVPEKARRVRVWDLACTEEGDAPDPDYTSALRAAMVEGHMYIEDVRRFRGSPSRIQSEMAACAELDGQSMPIHIEQEKGSAGKNLIDLISRTTLLGYVVVSESPTGEKAVRATPLANAAERGHVHLVRGQWNSAFLDEAEFFPSGKHKDQIDTAAYAYNILAMVKKRPKAANAS